MKRLICCVLCCWAVMGLRAAEKTASAASVVPAERTDSVLWAAYKAEDMTVWKEHISKYQVPSTKDLLYEYGYCGYIVAEAKKEGKEALLPEAKRYVQQLKDDIERQKARLPKGHYEMYMSAVYVYELRLHESMRPVKAVSLAKEATKLAPDDPLVLSYYGTSLFYAPKPFGSKAEALEWFEKAVVLFNAPEWQYCWVREANEMYIRQCKEKIKVQRDGQSPSCELRIEN